MNPGLLPWEHRVLTTRPPGKSPGHVLVERNEDLGKTLKDKEEQGSVVRGGRVGGFLAQDSPHLSPRERGGSTRLRGSPREASA